MGNDYAGMFVIDLSDMMVLAGADSKHPDERKAMGGMRKAQDTSIRSIAYREIMEEGQTQVLESTLVFVEKRPNHTRYFFLADKISNALAKGATWEVEERDAHGKIREKITARWVPFFEFVERLFDKQHPAFGAVLAVLARRNPQLLNYQKYLELMDRFPEPDDLGIEGVNVD